MLKRLLLIALFVVGSTVLYAQSSGSSGSSQGTQDQPGASGQQGTQPDQPGASGQQGTQQDQPASSSGSSSSGSSTTSDQSGSSNTGSGGSTGGTSTQNKMVTGTISKIDHDTMTITIKDDTSKETSQFTISSSATMTKDGASITHKDLKKGDHVTVEVDGQNAVQKIDVMSKSGSHKEGQDKH